MSSFAAFCKRKDIEISVQRYLIDALGAMAQGLFASLLMGTGALDYRQRAGIDVLVQVGDFAKSAAGPVAVSIGFALKAPSCAVFPGGGWLHGEQPGRRRWSIGGACGCHRCF